MDPSFSGVRALHEKANTLPGGDDDNSTAGKVELIIKGTYAKTW